MSRGEFILVKDFLARGEFTLKFAPVPEARPVSFIIGCVGPRPQPTIGISSSSPVLLLRSKHKLISKARPL
jgi:hypothetical protein